MAQIVYDNDYVVDEMTEKGWPVRWQPWPAAADGEPGNWTSADGSRSLRNRRLRGRRAVAAAISISCPRSTIGNCWTRKSLPQDYQPRPRLITDFYAYNTSVQRGGYRDQPQMLGLHWVGDLMLECQLEVTKAEGTAILDLVKGGRHFRCELDCASGEAVLSIDGLEDYRAQGQDRVSADRAAIGWRLPTSTISSCLWVDGTPVEFDGPTDYAPLDNDRPQSDGRRSGRPAAGRHRLARRGPAGEPRAAAARYLLHRHPRRRPGVGLLAGLLARVADELRRAGRFLVDAGGCGRLPDRPAPSTSGARRSSRSTPISSLCWATTAR